MKAVCGRWRTDDEQSKAARQLTPATSKQILGFNPIQYLDEVETPWTREEYAASQCQ